MTEKIIVHIPDDKTHEDAQELAALLANFLVARKIQCKIDIESDSAEYDLMHLMYEVRKDWQKV